MSIELEIQKGLLERWEAKDIPYNESLAFDMPEIEGLNGIKRVPSMRALLVHKLNMICVAQTPPTWREVANVLRVTDGMIRKWRGWVCVPGGVHMWQRIDTHYEVALERLRLKALKKAENAK